METNKQTTDITKGKCLDRWKISKHQERKLKENRKSTNNPTNQPKQKNKCVDREVSVCDRSVRIILNKIIFTFKKFKGNVDC